MEQRAFIGMVWEAVQDIDLHGSHTSVVIAQAAVESGWGSSKLSAEYNNYFGIKVSKSWTGKSVNMNTGEVINGKQTVIASNFRVYNSLIDSIKDRVNVMRNYYQSALQADTPLQEIEAIKAGGWATSTNYVNAVYSVVNTYNLTNYDTKYQNTMKAKTTYFIFLTIGVIIVGLAVYKLAKM